MTQLLNQAVIHKPKRINKPSRLRTEKPDTTQEADWTKNINGTRPYLEHPQTLMFPGLSQNSKQLFTKKPIINNETNNSLNELMQFQQETEALTYIADGWLGLYTMMPQGSADQRAIEQAAIVKTSIAEIQTQGYPNDW